MANEATIQVSMTIRKSSGTVEILNKQYTANFSATVTGSKGPTPGAFTVSTAGTEVDLTELTTPGLCWIKNLDASKSVEYGIWEPATSTFYPLGLLLPGEAFPLRLSPNIREQYDGTGTGTSARTNKFMFKAIGGSMFVSVEAFEN